MKEFIAHENDGYRLRVTKHECTRPDGLLQINFIQELKNDDGEIEQHSMYELFMTQEQLNNLAKELIE